jgi:hypothetical protein
MSEYIMVTGANIYGYKNYLYRIITMEKENLRCKELSDFLKTRRARILHLRLAFHLPVEGEHPACGGKKCLNWPE